LHYCEWYEDKDKRPGVCPDTNLVKTHDRDLDWPIREDWKYLVLIRHPLFAVRSWQQFDREGGDYNIPWKLEFWNQFVLKWVIRPVPNRLVVFYETLVNSPAYALASIIHFLETDQSELSQTRYLERLNDLIQKHAIAPRRVNLHDWIDYV
jgi:hypothetical protein